MSDFRKQANEAADTFDQMEAALADVHAYADTLERLLETAGVKAPLPPPPPLKVYPTINDIEWEQWPDTDDTWSRFPEWRMRLGLFNKQAKAAGRHLPWRNVIVEQYGELSNIEVRRGSGVQDDYELIINRRCLDVVGKIKPMWVQSGDDGFESDAGDKERLARNYQGKLNQPLTFWRKDYQQYAEILAAARPDLVGDWEASRFDLAPTP